MPLRYRVPILAGISMACYLIASVIANETGRGFFEFGYNLVAVTRDKIIPVNDWLSLVDSYSVMYGLIFLLAIVVIIGGYSALVALVVLLFVLAYTKLAGPKRRIDQVDAP